MNRKGDLAIEPATVFWLACTPLDRGLQKRGRNGQATQRFQVAHEAARHAQTADDVRPRALVETDLCRARRETEHTATEHHAATSLKRVSVAAGVPSVTARGIRHTYASLQARRGVSLEEIGAAMGHADGGKTAARHYIEQGAAANAGIDRVAGLLADGRERRKKAKP